MKHTGAITFTASLILCIIFTFPTQSAAVYHMGNMYVQHRVNADGTVSNHLYFEVWDENDQYIPGGSVVTGVNLYDKDSTLVDISTVAFDGGLIFRDGEFDTDTGSWTYNPEIYLNGYNAEINDPLIEGIYHLEVTCDDLVTYDNYYTFNQQVTLPVINPRSFQIHSDSAGNVYWSWDIPADLLELSESVQTEYRPYVSIFNDSQLVGLLWPTVPTQMNMVFIPPSLVQWITTNGNRYRFTVQVRTSDNNNRSYSKSVYVTDMSTTVTKKKQSVVIPLY